jgi:hypothetical protein
LEVIFFGRFTTGSCKKYLLASPCPSDCLHVTPQEQICIKFDIRELLSIVDNITVCLNEDKPKSLLSDVEIIRVGDYL